MKAIILVLFLIPLLAACSSTNTPVTQSSNDLMPLAVGNQWTYHEWRADSTHVLRPQADFTITLLSTSVKGGNTYYQSDLGARYFYTSQGLWSETNGVLSPHFFAKHPVVLNEQMALDSVAITDEQSPDPLDLAIGTQTLTGENVPYTTSSGTTYNTVQYRRTYRGTVHDSVYLVELQYFQLGTGLVMHSYLAPDATGTLQTTEKWELANATVK